MDREVVGTFHEFRQDADDIQEPASWACPWVGIPSSWAVPYSVVVHDEDGDVVLVESSASSDVGVFRAPLEMELDVDDPNWEEDDDPCGHSMEHLVVASPSKLHRQLAWQSRLHAGP